MNAVTKLWLGLLLIVGITGTAFWLGVVDTEARNILRYRDTISDSAPGAPANHTLHFTLNTDVSDGGFIEITPPTGFEILATSTFAERNVELYVNGVPRQAASAPAPGVDGVEIFPGSPGMIRYTLGGGGQLATGDELELRIGNHTSNSVDFSVEFSSTTGTTTTFADSKPIVNGTTLGTQTVKVEVWDGAMVADAGFLIHLNERVSIPGVDTTEEIPPVRFNPAPTSTVGGTTASVEISLETDEFANCRYALAPDVPYSSMPFVFSNTGLLFHSTVVAVQPGTTQRFYVRCIDDESNSNFDDFIIQFVVNERPTGQANTDGSTSGNGTGTGNSGTGTGSGGGGTSGGSSGEAPVQGGSSGTGGSGGGGGGGRGGTTGNTAGGGFESEDDVYRSGDARVIISGYSFPNSDISVLVDGKVARTTRSNGAGIYSVTLDEIARGVYTFGVYAEDADDIKSSTFSTSFTVTGGRVSELTNINTPPSIRVNPNPVDPGQTLTVSGYAIANSTVTIQTGPQRARLMPETTTTADASGRWSTTLSTSGFSRGTYQVRAKAQRDTLTSDYSGFTFYGVGESAQGGSLNADLSRDTRINLTDFSILLFWWNSNGGDSNPSADINADGRVTLTDFSILLFNWTG